ncbi:MAG TPA: aminoglycoside phosphotransferase family protein [Syntrophomonadaceae bacterium]|nr:aminoglycoside phosphotransferase family protein [Syntrophomonadaceae bacterium]
MQFLAQGEYNLNYVLKNRQKRFVFRVNTASQMQLENQIAYEYKALQLLKRSGVTPRPYYLDDQLQKIPYGVLVMEYLPGEPLDYRCDLISAASTLANIHGLASDPAETQFLIREPGPFTGIYNEASRMLVSYFKDPEADIEVRDLLEKALIKADDRRKGEKYLLQEPCLAVINTEVNSHNFIVNRQANTCHLIDWEKPIYGEPAQDLSMFLIATSTLWKQNYRLSFDEEQGFLNAYLKNSSWCPYQDTLFDRVEMFKYFNYLRAISWCAMAWTEYRKPGRLIVNQDTYQKIESYLQPDFIRSSIQ